MRFRISILLLFLSAAFRGISADRQAVFGGRESVLRIELKNTTDREIEGPASFRIWQVTKGVAMPVGEVLEWKRVKILGGQTLLDELRVTLPRVQAGSHFVVKVRVANDLIGEAIVNAYPANLLRQVQPLLEGGAIGLLETELSPAPFLAQGFDVTAAIRLKNFSGALLVVGEGVSEAGTVEQIHKWSERGGRVIWLKAADVEKPATIPSALVKRIGRGVIVEVESRALTDLGNSPLAQLNFVRAAQMATRLEAFTLVGN